MVMFVCNPVSENDSYTLMRFIVIAAIGRYWAYCLLSGYILVSMGQRWNDIDGRIQNNSQKNMSQCHLNEVQLSPSATCSHGLHFRVTCRLTLNCVALYCSDQACEPVRYMVSRHRRLSVTWATPILCRVSFLS